MDDYIAARLQCAVDCAGDAYRHQFSADRGIL